MRIVSIIEASSVVCCRISTAAQPFKAVPIYISVIRMLLKLVTGNGERGTGNGERGTGNGERGTGNGERESGNECTAVTRLRIQNGGGNDVYCQVAVCSVIRRLAFI